jgi:hypothetical protein
MLLMYYFQCPYTEEQSQDWQGAAFPPPRKHLILTHPNRLPLFQAWSIASKSHVTIWGHRGVTMETEAWGAAWPAPFNWSPATHSWKHTITNQWDHLPYYPSPYLTSTHIVIIPITPSQTSEIGANNPLIVTHCQPEISNYDHIIPITLLHRLVTTKHISVITNHYFTNHITS